MAHLFQSLLYFAWDTQDNQDGVQETPYSRKINKN